MGLRRLSWGTGLNMSLALQGICHLRPNPEQAPTATELSGTPGASAPVPGPQSICGPLCQAQLSIPGPQQPHASHVTLGHRLSQAVAALF